MGSGGYALLVEDDADVGDLVQFKLEQSGMDVVSVGDGAAALEACASHGPDLVLLDVMMPGMSGLDVCRSLRRSRQLSGVPVIMLTARAQESDIARGFEAGADDYVVKPFDVEEVFARLRALLRRTGGADSFARPPQPPTAASPASAPASVSASAAPASPPDGGGAGLLTAAGLRMDVQARRAWRGARELELTRTEFDLLELLVRNAGIVLYHATIYDRIWGYDFGPGSKNLAVYVGYLRRKLDEPGAPALIHTVRGVGYARRED
jgi:two-component system, OmpR family, response regulator MprA